MVGHGFCSARGGAAARAQSLSRGAFHVAASASSQPTGWVPGKAIVRGEGRSSRPHEAQAQRLHSLTPSVFSGLEQFRSSLASGKVNRVHLIMWK